MPAEDDSGTVMVEGATTVSVTASHLGDRFPREVRSFTIRCHSGRTIEGQWRGVPLAPIIEAAAFPPETTHVRVAARDGHTAFVPVRDASAAFLGFERLALAVTGGEPAERPGTPRLLGAALDSTQVVRDVDRIAAMQVPPGMAPETVGAR